jgi:FMN phosphatase YigB (HAD superfamily)
MRRFDSIFKEFPLPPAVTTGTGHGGPNLARKPAVILFDIYGTLVSSTLGDLEEQRQTARDAAGFIATARRFGLDENQGRQWEKSFFEEIELEHAQCRAQGITRAEVLIEEIWRRLIESTRPDRFSARPEDLALYRELTANPVALFQGVEHTLQSLKEQGFILGLASNSQFHTLPILERLLGASLDRWFDPNWSFLSYRLGFAKPDPHFFRLALTRALRHGYRPDQVLMVGNDLENDIWSAMLHGIQAVHFIHRPMPSPAEASEVPFVHDFQSLLELCTHEVLGS